MSDSFVPGQPGADFAERHIVLRVPPSNRVLAKGEQTTGRSRGLDRLSKTPSEESSRARLMTPPVRAQLAAWAMSASAALQRLRRRQGCLWVISSCRASMALDVRNSGFFVSSPFNIHSLIHRRIGRKSSPRVPLQVHLGMHWRFPSRGGSPLRHLQVPLRSCRRPYTSVGKALRKHQHGGALAS